MTRDFDRSRVYFHQMKGDVFFFFAKGFTKITMNVNKASNLRHPECLNLAARLEQLDRGSNLIVFVMVFMLGGKFREVQQKNGCVFVFFFVFFYERTMVRKQ